MDAEDSMLVLQTLMLMMLKEYTDDTKRRHAIAIADNTMLMMLNTTC